MVEGAGLTLLRATGWVGSLTEGVAEAVTGLTAEERKVSRRGKYSEIRTCC